MADEEPPFCCIRTKSSDELAIPRISITKFTSCMKKTILIILMTIFLGSALMSQDYDTGIGLKVGMAPGLSVKHFFTTNGALEGIATYRWNGVNVTGLAEFHLPVFDTEGMYFFYGGGIHLGVWDSGKAIDKLPTGSKFNFGVDGVIGIEYAFSDVPLCLGLDWKPNVNIVTDTRFIMDEISIILRYIIR
jgi:hypothetical protein